MSHLKLSSGPSPEKPRRAPGAIQPRNWLKLWRSASPGRLRSMPAAAANLLAFLATVFVPRSDEERQLLDAMLRGTETAACAFHLARLLWTACGDPPDAAMSWLLLAALRRHDLAIATLSQVLRDRAAGLERNVQEALLNEDGPDAVRALRHEAKLARRLMRNWSEELHLSFLAAPLKWQRLFEPPQLSTPEAPNPPAPVGPSDATTSMRPTLQVVKEIGFPETQDESIASAYQGLTEPLPLMGADLASDVLRATLLLEFPHMAEAVDHVVDDLALRRWAGLSWAHVRPLLLVGAPGVGKSRFGRRLARLLGSRYGEIDVAGSSDNRMLQGTARGWKGAQAAWPLLIMKQTGCANPILLIDEVDKAGASRSGGDVRKTLLAWLEPETARAWHDECLLAPADLSQVSRILTANDLEAIPSVLLSRVQIARVERPGAEAFDGILEGILRDLANGLSVDRHLLPELEPTVREQLRRAFVRGTSVRTVKRMVRTLVARSAREPPPRH